MLFCFSSVTVFCASLKEKPEKRNPAHNLEAHFCRSAGTVLKNNTDFFFILMLKTA